MSTLIPSEIFSPDSKHKHKHRHDGHRYDRQDQMHHVVRRFASQFDGAGDNGHWPKGDFDNITGTGLFSTVTA